MGCFIILRIFFTYNLSVMYMMIFYIILFLASIFYLAIMIFAKKGRGFFRIQFFNAFTGIVILFIINLTSKFTNVFLPINYVTVITSSFFGMPGVCGLMLGNFIMLL